MRAHSFAHSWPFSFPCAHCFRHVSTLGLPSASSEYTLGHCTTVQRTVRSPLSSNLVRPLTRPFVWIHTSSISEPFSQLWCPHPCRRGLSRRPRWLAPSRTVPLLPSSALPLLGACQPLTLTSHAPSSKISKSLSFFPLRDSYGTTQLVVHTPPGDPPPEGGVQQSNLPTDLARIPVESTVLVQGHVRLRPEKQRRPVINTPYSFRLSDD